MEAIPRVFCWTKMGAEAGQDLEAILQRKELERASGSGTFGWGIGNSVAPALEHARRTFSSARVQVLFSPMKSQAKEIDAAPSELALWLAYIDSRNETRELPVHMLITSRLRSASGSEKKVHYALICKSDRRLVDRVEQSMIDASRVRNLVSENQVGASQVTAVVKYVDERKEGASRSYSVRLRADLVQQGVVRLVQPVRLNSELFELYRKVCMSTSVSEWRSRVARLKIVARHSASKEWRQVPLFQSDETYTEANLAALSACESSSL